MPALTVIGAATGAGTVLMATLIGGATGALTSAGNRVDSGCPASAPPGAGGGARDIPAAYLRLYQSAGNAYGIPWTILAAIGHIESHHGRDQSTSSAGARGPMQFMPATWAAYGVDGDTDGRRDITNPADALPAAARYLRANGAPVHLREAIFAYNHSTSYVDDVIAQARGYAAGKLAETTGDEGCDLAGPVSAPTVIAAKVIAYARAQVGKPYIYGGTGPTGYDCSGLTMMAYRSAGIAIPRLSDAQYWFGARVPTGQEAPGDLVFFDYRPGHSGPGHVGIVYDVPRGLMLVAPHTGTNVRVQSYRNYPGGVVGFTRPYARHHGPRQASAPAGRGDRRPGRAHTATEKRGVQRMTGQGISWIRRVTTATAAGAAAVPTIPTTTEHMSAPTPHMVAVSTAWHRLTGRPTPMWWTGC